ncbi:MAG: hypothetical protein R3B09_06810 [Nannocystaceae bacterium]
MIEEICRWFSFESLDIAAVASVDRLLERLDASESALARRSSHVDNVDTIDDAEVFVIGTDDAFWSNASFLMRAQVSGQGGRFHQQALLVEACPSAAELVRYYHAHVWGKIFDVDTVLLGRATGHLLVVTHYGVIALFEPRKPEPLAHTVGGSHRDPQGP